MQQVRKKGPRATFTFNKRIVQTLESRRLLDQTPDPADLKAVSRNLGDVRNLFEGHLQCSQLGIRHGLADPRPHLQKAVAVAERCAIRWGKVIQKLKLETPGHITAFNFSLAALLALLTHKDIPPTLRAVVPSVPAWRPEDTSLGAIFTDVTGVPSAYCDSGLLHMIQHNRRPKNWASILAILDSRTSLWHGTYTTYADIIFNAHAGRWTDAWKSVEVAHGLYEQRGRHYYTEFLSWEGDKSSNESYIDIRLTVLIHRCFPKARLPRESPAFIHRLSNKE